MNYSIKKAIKNDMFMLFPLIGFVIFLLVGLESYFLGYMFTKRQGLFVLDNSLRLTIGLIFTSVAIILLVLFFFRLKLINSYFINGHQLIGKIIKIEYFKDRGYIHYEYKVLGKNYKGKVFIHQTKETMQYKTNDEVNILVNVNKNSRSIIKTMYK